LCKSATAMRATKQSAKSTTGCAASDHRMAAKVNPRHQSRGFCYLCGHGALRSQFARSATQSVAITELCGHQLRSLISGI
jgi:hypothetical protein